jgi:hypothetical protein
MQNLGLSEGTPKSEGFFRRLIWPRIEDAVDADQASRSAFWICMVIAAFTALLAVAAGPAALIATVIYFMAGMGVREKSLMAGVTAFLAYLIDLVAVPSVPKFLLLALLFTGIRAALWARRNPEAMREFQALPRLQPSWSETLADVWPPKLWRWMQPIYLLLVILFLTLMVLGLLSGGAKV